MLSIALVTPILPLPFDPTRGRFILETARALSRLARTRVFLLQARYPVDLNRFKSRALIDGRVDADYTIDGLDMKTINYPVIPALSRAVNPFVSGARLMPHLKRFKPDAVIGYWIYPDGYAALRAADQLGVPGILGALGSDVYVRSGWNVRMTRKSVRRADGIITVSETMKQALVDQYNGRTDKIVAVRNGFDSSVFKPGDRTAVRAALGYDSDARLIVYTGRLVREKGLVELIDAFARLREAGHATLQLTLIGQGGMQQTLQTQAEQRGVAAHIRFTGGLSPREVSDHLVASDLFCLPSWSEGYPNVVVEALACGRPVVSTNVGGVAEILHQDNGVFVPTRNVDGLVAGLEAAIERRWNHAAIAAASERSWHDVARETLAFTERVVTQHRSGVAA